MSTENTVAEQAEQYAKAAREKPCIDCKHAIGERFYYCRHPLVAKADVVTGIRTTQCEEARAPGGACTVSGRYFASSRTPEHKSG